MPKPAKAEEDGLSLDFSNYIAPGSAMQASPAPAASPASPSVAAEPLPFSAPPFSVGVPDLPDFEYKPQTRAEPVDNAAPADAAPDMLLDFSSMTSSQPTTVSASESGQELNKTAAKASTLELLPLESAVAEPKAAEKKAQPAKSAKSGASSKKKSRGAATIDFDEFSAPNPVLPLESGAHDVPPPVEEAAVLFANGEAQAALDKLDSAIDQNILGSWTLAAWLMRFDLYQDLGRKNEFEERALDFVMKFERSSPAWSDAIAAAAQAGARTTASAQIALSGSLSAASKGAFEQLRKGSERQSKLRIDFSRLEGVDAEGCELLRATLKMLQRASKEVYISGESHMLALLKARAVAGDSSVDQAIWLLLLDLYQNLDMHEQFEESAVDYAVTYEVSPPSWEARTRLQLAPAPRIEAAGRFEKSDDSFRLEGELAGTQDALFDEVEAYAAKANLPTFDFGAARRIDVANAGRLAGVAEKVVKAGKPIVMRSVGEMTIALFTVVGLHKLARIIPRK